MIGEFASNAGIHGIRVRVSLDHNSPMPSTDLVASLEWSMVVDWHWLAVGFYTPSRGCPRQLLDYETLVQSWVSCACSPCGHSVDFQDAKISLLAWSERHSALEVWRSKAWGERGEGGGGHPPTWISKWSSATLCSNVDSKTWDYWGLCLPLLGQEASTY